MNARTFFSSSPGSRRNSGSISLKNRLISGRPPFYLAIDRSTEFLFKPGRIRTGYVRRCSPPFPNQAHEKLAAFKVPVDRFLRPSEHRDRILPTNKLNLIPKFVGKKRVELIDHGLRSLALVAKIAWRSEKYLQHLADVCHRAFAESKFLKHYTAIGC